MVQIITLTVQLVVKDTDTVDDVTREFMRVAETQQDIAPHLHFWTSIEAKAKWGNATIATTLTQTVLDSDVNGTFNDGEKRYGEIGV